MMAQARASGGIVIAPVERLTEDLPRAPVNPYGRTKAAIEQTLRQVHWNRRKAAQLLGVSYKTLLNKIKECGIRQ